MKTLNLSNPHVRIVYSAVQTVQIVVKLVIEVLEVKFLGQIPPPLNIQGSRGKTFTRFYQYYSQYPPACPESEIELFYTVIHERSNQGSKFVNTEIYREPSIAM